MAPGRVPAVLVHVKMAYRAVVAWTELLNVRMTIPVMALAIHVAAVPGRARHVQGRASTERPVVIVLMVQRAVLITVRVLVRLKFGTAARGRRQPALAHVPVMYAVPA